MKKLLSILLAICILAMTMTTVVMAEGEEDLALSSKGASVIGTSKGTHETNVKGNAIDGDEETKWSCWTSTTEEHWIEVDLGKCATVNQIKFYSINSSDQKFYTVSYSLDRETWSEPKQPSKDSGYLFVNLSNELVRYVKIIQLEGKNKTMLINEIWVNGTYTSLPYLKSLTANGGKFTTDFSKDVFSYKLQVEDFNDLPELTFEPYMSGVTAEITQTADSSNNYTTNITVTHQDETKVYSVQYVPYNWALSVNGASATGFETNEKQPESNAIDGDTSTMWQSASSTVKEGRWLQVTLAEPMLINEISFLNTSSGNNNNWKIEYSLTGEDGTWIKTAKASRPNGSNKPYIQIVSFSTNPVLAQHVKFTYLSNVKNMAISDVEVYGDKLTNDLTASSGISSDKKLIGNIAHLNNAQESVNDNCYIMAIYVDDVLYSVIPADKSANTILAGAIATTSISSAVLPETGTVTAKLFVWNSLENLVPVTAQPITLR